MYISLSVLLSGIRGSGVLYERWKYFSDIAEEFLQVAAQAPHPIQAAASIASSALSFAIGIALASGTPPVLTET